WLSTVDRLRPRGHCPVDELREFSTDLAQRNAGAAQTLLHRTDPTGRLVQLHVHSDRHVRILPTGSSRGARKSDHPLAPRIAVCPSPFAARSSALRTRRRWKRYGAFSVGSRRSVASSRWMFRAGSATCPSGKRQSVRVPSPERA